VAAHLDAGQTGPLGKRQAARWPSPPLLDTEFIWSGGGMVFGGKYSREERWIQMIGGKI